MEQQEGSNAEPVFQLVDINEWTKEQDHLDAERAKLSSRIPPPSKKPKRVVDVDEVTAEEGALNELGDENWIGKLIEYRNAHPIAGGGITWAEATVASPIPRFTCTVVIAEAPDHFGRTSPSSGLGSGCVTFSSKKNAKKFAAKQAIDWLIANQRMPSNGAVRFPKPTPLPQPPKAKPKARPSLSYQGYASEEGDGESYAVRIPELCYRLGFNVPRYNLTQAAPNSPLYDIHADFGGDGRIDGNVGEIRNVFGKKNAKEQCAREVYSFLKDIESQRLKQVEDEDKKRKRSTSPSETDDRVVIQVES